MMTKFTVRDWLIFMYDMTGIVMICGVVWFLMIIVGCL